MNGLVKDTCAITLVAYNLIKKDLFVISVAFDLIIIIIVFKI
jgi:hypothetical protein